MGLDAIHDLESRATLEVTRSERHVIMLEIDGSAGEGGGQILRTSLALAMITGHAFHLARIRAGRKKPGLARQHLTAVKAAAEVCGGALRGAALHSSDLTFTPGRISPGDYRFAIGTAGSTSLVLQTVLPALLRAEEPSTLVLEGGTHNEHAPPFEFLSLAYLPLLNRLGPRVTATLERPGFYPAGGGKVVVRIEPAARLGRLELRARGSIRDVRARAIVAKLPRHIAERELKTVERKLPRRPRVEAIEETRSSGPGNVLLIEIESEHVTEVVTGFGRLGVSAETVATDACREAADFLDADVPVGAHLADQLLLPLALGDGGAYLTQPATEHTRTNADVIRRFLDVSIEVVAVNDRQSLVQVNPL